MLLKREGVTPRTAFIRLTGYSVTSIDAAKNCMITVPSVHAKACPVATQEIPMRMLDASSNIDIITMPCPSHRC